MTIGETITLDQLEADPYPIYARLRDEEPVSWVPAVGLWLVTRHDDVKLIDLSPEIFTAATEPSTLNRTMGENMLGMEGAEQRWIRAITEIPYRPRDVEARTKGMIPELANELVDAVVADGEADLFHAYADPMSVRSLRFMLGLDEVPWEDILRWNEGLMPGLANFEGDPREAGAGRRGERRARRGDRAGPRPARGRSRRLGPLVDAPPRGGGPPDVAGADRREHEADALRRAAGAARPDRPHPVGARPRAGPPRRGPCGSRAREAGRRGDAPLGGTGRARRPARPRATSSWRA